MISTVKNAVQSVDVVHQTNKNSTKTTDSRYSTSSINTANPCETIYTPVTDVQFKEKEPYHRKGSRLIERGRRLQVPRTPRCGRPTSSSSIRNNLKACEKPSPFVTNLRGCPPTGQIPPFDELCYPPKKVKDHVKGRRLQVPRTPRCGRPTSSSWICNTLKALPMPSTLSVTNRHQFEKLNTISVSANSKIAAKAATS